MLARCGFKHTLLSRLVMAFGHAEQVTEAEEKRRALDRFIDRLYAGRSRELRAISDEELAATSVMAMTIEEATAKISSPRARGGGIGVIDKEADYAAAVWAGVIPSTALLGRRKRTHGSTSIRRRRRMSRPTPKAHVLTRCCGKWRRGKRAGAAARMKPMCPPKPAGRMREA